MCLPHEYCSVACVCGIVSLQWWMVNLPWWLISSDTNSPVERHPSLQRDQEDTQNWSEKKCQITLVLGVWDSSLGSEKNFFFFFFSLVCHKCWTRTSVNLRASPLCSSTLTRHSSFLVLRRLFTHCAPLSRTVCDHRPQYCYCIQTKSWWSIDTNQSVSNLDLTGDLEV